MAKCCDAVSFGLMGVGVGGWIKLQMSLFKQLADNRENGGDK